MAPRRSRLLFAMLAAWPLLSPAEGPDAAPAPAYTPRGADTCLKCHDEDSKVPVLAIFKTPHGRQGDSRVPFGQLQCESCHGPGADHAQKVRAGEVRPQIRNFGRHAQSPVEDQNGACLGCHQDSARIGWHGSAHDSASVSCASCHTVHSARDPVLEAAGQVQACGNCHARERAAHNSIFSHPLRQGAMGCDGCHAVHGSSMGPALLKQASVNESCFACHADKRGPFLWEHAPAAEDCALCHAPHGSSHAAMLSRPAPLLCQSCHSQAGHPSLALSPDGLPAGSPNAFLLGNSCANCHSQVHGSNHPSGAKLLR